MITNHHSTSPLISVIMPVYNREEFVGEAIESILHQTYENFELIIADDGSTDGTAPIIHEYARSDRRIRPVFIRHRGIPKTLNTAIEAARGLYIAFADADDVSLPERLIRQSEWMDENRIDISGANAEVFGDSRDMNGWKEGVNWLPESHEAIRREMLFRVALWRGAAMIKTAVCKENPFNENIGLTDCDWPMRMVVKYKMGNVPSVLVRVRRHADNATLIKKTSCLKEFRKSRFKYFYHFFPKTPLDDYIAFSRVADRQPMTSIWELERAGQWLVELSDYQDEELQKKMAKRWEESCKRSKALGASNVDEIRQHYMEKLNEIRRMSITGGK